MSNTSAFFRRREVQDILKALIDKEIKTIEPSLSFDLGVCYEAISVSIKKEEKEIIEILEELADRGILEREITGNIAVCPICGSHKLMMELCCPTCKSRRIVKGGMIEHIKCGYVDLEELFRNEDRLICPKCGKTLTIIGVDYRKPGVVYKCLSCGTLTPTAEKHYICNKTHPFDEHNILMRPIASYTFNPEKRVLVEKELIEFDSVLEGFREVGWIVESPAIVEGESGVQHQFSFSIWFQPRPSDGRWPDLVADHYAEENEVESTNLLAFQAKAMDVHSKEKILVAMPCLDKNAKLLAKGFGITTVEASTATEVKEKLKQALLDIKQKRSREGLKAEKEALEEALKELGGTLDRT
ncbi:MAG: hypothetical protein HA494_01885 [Thaumarchaeota archaeon]|nr:hypothetical protein [Nitrososphaerota archaeon]